MTAVEEWKKTTKSANFYLYTSKGYFDSWSQDVQNDLYSVIIASVLVGVYVICFLGSFSPLHCRLMVSLAGAASVLLSFFSGHGFLSLCGLKYSNFNSWLPFLLMAIGVEHFFIICNNLD